MSVLFPSTREPVCTLSITAPWSAMIGSHLDPSAPCEHARIAADNPDIG